MNRFIIEHHPDAIAKSLCDKHIVKMPLEEAQMLCTSLWHHAPEYAEEQGLYKPVHQKHPCTLWAMETQANYSFAYSLYVSMLCEYHHRYGKWHGAGKHSVAIHHGIVHIPQGGLTPHPQCFSGHDDCKTDGRLRRTWLLWTCGPMGQRRRALLDERRMTMKSMTTD